MYSLDPHRADNGDSKMSWIEFSSLTHLHRWKERREVERKREKEKGGAIICVTLSMCILFFLTLKFLSFFSAFFLSHFNCNLRTERGGEGERERRKRAEEEENTWLQMQVDYCCLWLLYYCFAQCKCEHEAEANAREQSGLQAYWYMCVVVTRNPVYYSTWTQTQTESGERERVERERGKEFKQNSKTAHSSLREKQEEYGGEREQD